MFSLVRNLLPHTLLGQEMNICCQPFRETRLKSQHTKTIDLETSNGTSAPQYLQGEYQIDCIYTTAITKYVPKQRRKICTPGLVTHKCGLLPLPPTTEGLGGLRPKITIESDSYWK
ncbi:hypothetical protein BDU57DRAFT_577292 [Ampelomyces quisqualis]|uniref:Uncharacterized protein n=1 Tax=Ampelomyces quisqualis TaxID=50730 RepID=A0A6A5QJD1_AMPQU|nr:hypothetical protein BDU57DRAFT_577292 [Ampelomyces quisqualis]